MPSAEPLLASRAQKAFIGTITIQAIAVLAIVAVVFRKVDDAIPKFTGGYKTLPCYLSLFALAEVFELVMAYDALRLRNVIQLAGILLFHFALIIMSGLQVHQTEIAIVQQTNCDATVSFLNCDGEGTLWASVEPFLIAAPCIIGAAWLAMLFFAKQLYAEFGYVWPARLSLDKFIFSRWAIFHVVGANPRMKVMYQYYQIMLCLLNEAEFAVTIAAIPIVLLLLILCGIALQREIKWIMTISQVLMLPAMGYFLYKLVRFYEPSSREQYSTTRASLTLFTIVAFLLLFATFVIGLRCFADFDRGLLTSKTHGIAPSRSKLRDSKSTPNTAERKSSYMGGQQLAPRISIE